MIDNNTILCWSDDYIITEIDEICYIIPNTADGVNNEKLFQTKGVGKDILLSIDGYKTINQIAQQIGNEYKISTHRALEDALIFLKKLIDLNILFYD